MKAVKVTLFTSKSKGAPSFCSMMSMLILTHRILSDADGSFGLEAVDFREALEEALYTPESVLLAKLQEWLLHASVASESAIARDLALQAAQKMALATGSLCGLLTLASMLILHSVSSTEVDSAPSKYDEQNWRRMDVLSETAQQFSQRFLSDLCKSVQELLDNGKAAATEEVLANPKRLPPIPNDSGGSGAHERQADAHTSSSAESPPPVPLTLANADKTSGSTQRAHKV